MALVSHETWSVMMEVLLPPLQTYSKRQLVSSATCCLSSNEQRSLTFLKWHSQYLEKSSANISARTAGNDDAEERWWEVAMLNGDRYSLVFTAIAITVYPTTV